MRRHGSGEFAFQECLHGGLVRKEKQTRKTAILLVQRPDLPLETFGGGEVGRKGRYFGLKLLGGQIIGKADRKQRSAFPHQFIGDFDIHCTDQRIVDWTAVQPGVHQHLCILVGFRTNLPVDTHHLDRGR